MWIAEAALKTTFALYSKLAGLPHYHLPDMDEIATISHGYYDNHLRGGEGHMEVGKLIQTVRQRKAHMVISVKPFGCMPSSGVSDGVQSLVVEKYPEAVFCAIETTGDGAANAQSRVMMDLFKARSRARDEYARVLGESGMTEDVLRARYAERSAWQRATHYPPAGGLAGTSARLLRRLCAR